MIAAFLYGLGYVVWALHAWRYNLGLLPAIDSQYFIAGIVPAAAAVIAYNGTKWADVGLTKVRDFLGPDATGIRGVLRIVMFASVVLSFLLFMVHDADWFRRLFPKLAASRLVALWIILFLLLPAPKQSSSYAPLMRFYSWFMIRYVAVFLPVLALTFYSEKLHPLLPQEIGGGRPRCAMIDIDRSQLSALTANTLFNGATSVASAQIQQSLAVNVYFDNSDLLLVKPHNQSQPNTATYEIKRETVRGITWCK